MISIGCVKKKIMVRNRRRQKERLITILKGDSGSSKKDSLIKIGRPKEANPSIDREIQSKENASMVRYIVDAIIDGCFSGENSDMGNLTSSNKNITDSVPSTGAQLGKSFSVKLST